MSWIAIVKIVLELLPAIIAAIKAIEELLPESNKGAEKLALVREIITSTGDEANKNWPLIESTINRLVTFFNKLGIFKTSK
jgi:hypothetical protein